MSLNKVMIFILIIISTLLLWTTSNVCKYNFAVEKKTQIMNIITEEIDPSIRKAKIYYYKELNCNKVELDWDVDRVVDNLRTISVIIYQELNTDIRGNPN